MGGNWKNCERFAANTEGEFLFKGRNMSVSSASDKPLSFHYHFKFDNGDEKEFDIKLDGKTLDLICEPKEFYPIWTELSCNKCPNCPLSESQHSYCPVAKNVVYIIDFFKDIFSFEKVDLTISTARRDYFKRVPVQAAVSSLIGIYMTTSGCPILDKLRPMVSTHLPFASTKETIYRALSMYLLAQYMIYKKGETPDWDMNHLGEIYEAINKVNESFCKRLKQIDNIEDAALNAVVKLDCYAISVGFALSEDTLGDFEPLFKAYLK